MSARNKDNRKIRPPSPFNKKRDIDILDNVKDVMNDHLNDNNNPEDSSPSPSNLLLNDNEPMKHEGDVKLDVIPNNEDPSSPSNPHQKKAKVKLKKEDSDSIHVNFNTANNSIIPKQSTQSTNSDNDTSSSSTASSSITQETTDSTIDTNKQSHPSTDNTNISTSAPPSSTSSSSTKQNESSVTQQDRMQKLNFLKELYDHGYITVVEYKERKSQIIDEVTGTRTRTRTNSQIPVPRMYYMMKVNISYGKI